MDASPPRFHFTQDWFSRHIPIWKELFAPMRDGRLRVLEIGCFEGLATVWLLQNALAHPESHITCVDPFTGNVEHSAKDVEGLYDRFKSNVLDNFPPSKVTCLREESHRALKSLALSGAVFDVIYVDGDHHACAALEDLVLSYRVLAKGGILIIDDFLPTDRHLCSLEIPFPGVHAFMTAYADKVRVVYANYQLILQKRG
jgi:predicted O-methyltransferase YrrM